MCYYSSPLVAEPVENNYYKTHPLPQVMYAVRFLCLVFLANWISMGCLSQFGFSQVSEIQPRICRPGETTELTLTGKELDKSLRLLTSHPNLNVKIDSVTAEQAKVQLQLPPDFELGPLGVWTSTHTAPSQPWILIVDDLPAVVHHSPNVTLETAHKVPTLAAISGVSRGNQSDFYRIEVSEGQRVAFEVLTQWIGSPMDPVARLLSANGQQLAMFDDDATGPEPRFSYQFETAGDYFLEVRDSKYSAGGHYHLRIGDFPILATAAPLFVRRGDASTIQWKTWDTSVAEPRKLTVPTDSREDSIFVSTKQPGGKSSAWSTIGVVSWPVRSIPSAGTPEESQSENSVTQHDVPANLQAPFVACGNLTNGLQHDSLLLHGIKDRTVRFSSKTRSLGSHAVLRMQLFRLEKAAGDISGTLDTIPTATKVAESKVSDLDEWSFDFKFPDDAVYRLQLSDLLSRSGLGFSYAVEVRPLPFFQLALKGDANTLLGFQLDAHSGARAVDLLVHRDGYEGAIDLRLEDGVEGLELLESLIPASAKEARVYVRAQSNWTAEQLESIRIVGQAVDDPQLRSIVKSSNILQLQKPYVPFPAAWSEGRILLAGSPTSAPFFSVDSPTPFRLARPINTHKVSMNLKRLAEDFKGTVTVLSQKLPQGWSAGFVLENDVCTATIARPISSNTDGQSGLVATPDSPVESIQLLAYAEHNQRGYMEALTVPVEWFDPLSVDIQSPLTAYAGTTIPLTLRLQRSGCDQPVTINWEKLPGGVELLGPVTLAADQSSTAVDLNIPADFSDPSLLLQYQVTSRYQDQDFSLSGQSQKLVVIAGPQRVEVFPAEIVLDGPKSQRQLIVTGFDSENSPRDWTSAATIRSAHPDVAEVRSGVVYPRSNGETQLEIQVGNLTQSIPVRVSQQQSEFKTLFESEVLVALSKQGCNSGACHGSPSGKGMFRLSLRAFDRTLDELTLIREDFGRRVNLVEPEESLLLLKPLMKTSHGGGRQLRTEDTAYQVLLQWIREGARPDPGNAARCVRLEVFPGSKRVLPLTEGRQQLSVAAHFADGTTRDVTELVAYESSNMQVATVDGFGLVRAVAKGEAVILVRFLEHIESMPLMFIDSNPQFEWRSPDPNNYVDELAYAKLRQMQYLPAETCSDAEFFRRVHLDVIGLLPSAEETHAFLSNTSADKRSHWIDDLLEREEYAKFWSQKWGDLLKLTGRLVGSEGIYKYHRWLEEAIRTDMPYDQFASELVTASGSTLSNPPANFYRTATDMNECVETVSQVFLGARLQCAKCHNHPFERWTQDNYYGLGAFFHRVERKKTQRPDEMFIWSGDSGEVTQPRTGQQVAPWLPVTGHLDATEGVDRRKMFADWLTAKDNPYFARIGANRAWSHLFSRGIVDPVDDFRDSNPPTNPALLDALADDFQKSGYSTKHLLRTILNSRTYQASSRADDTNRSDDLYFSHQHPRLLKAEQLLDALNHVTGVQQQFGSLPTGVKATQLPAPDIVKVDFLKVFGQPERSTVCACERSSDSNLAMAIELFNGPLIHERLRDSNNRFRRSLEAGKKPEEVLDELYLTALCRPATVAERSAALAHLQQRNDMTAGFEDICWALLNTDEFLFQH